MTKITAVYDVENSSPFRLHCVDFVVTDISDEGLLRALREKINIKSDDGEQYPEPDLDVLFLHNGRIVAQLMYDE